MGSIEIHKPKETGGIEIHNIVPQKGKYCRKKLQLFRYLLLFMPSSLF